jgi:type II secretory pathway component PulJ
MASNRTQLSLIFRMLRASKTKAKGFTLTELLVSIVMSTIIIATLLYVVVELLGVNTREEALTQTQQDMKRALDYINTDVSESVWIYADPTTATTQLTDLPSEDDGARPVLAFWRVDPIDTGQLREDCDDYSNLEEQEECKALKVRHFAHTLVVYLQQTNDDGDIWEGPRRILRYELSKYSDVSNLTERGGYLDPTTGERIDQEDIGFENWQRDPDEDETEGSLAVLTDYVDDPEDEEDAECPEVGTFTATPAEFNNFYVCVRGDASAQENRSLIVFLRGRAFDQERIVFGPRSRASSLPILESEVFIRGVIEEQPVFE